MNKETLFNLWKENNFIKPALFLGRYAEIISSNLKIYKYEDIQTTEIKIPVFDISDLSLDCILNILELYNNVVLLNTKEDILDSNLLSKINIVFKDSNINYNELLNAREANEIIKSNKIKDLDRFYANNSSELYYLKYKIKKYNGTSKYIELLSKDDKNVSK